MTKEEAYNRIREIYCNLSLSADDMICEMSRVYREMDENNG